MPQNSPPQALANVALTNINGLMFIGALAHTCSVRTQKNIDTHCISLALASTLALEHLPIGTTSWGILHNLTPLVGKQCPRHALVLYICLRNDALNSTEKGADKQKQWPPFLSQPAGCLA